MATYEGLSLDTKAKIVLVLNFYEELSGSYRAGLLDEKIAQNMLVPVLVHAWDAASWFIQYKRDSLEERENKEAADDAMCEWECLVRDLADGS